MTIDDRLRSLLRLEFMPRPLSESYRSARSLTLSLTTLSLTTLVVTLAAQVLLFAGRLAAESTPVGTSLGSLKVGDLALTITRSAATNESDAEFHIAIKTSKITESSVFSLADPPRIVIDLRGPTIAKNRELAIKSSLISRIRLGAHPKKTRFVIDLNSQPIPPYRWTAATDNALLRINLPASETQVATHESDSSTSQEEIAVPSPAGVKRLSPLDSSPVDTGRQSEGTTAESADEIILEEIIAREPTTAMTPEAAATPTPSPKPSPSIVPTLTPSPTPTHAPTMTAVSAAVTASADTRELPTSDSLNPPEQPPTDGAQEVVALEFGYSTEKTSNPTIKIKLASKSEFQFSKTEAREYRLTVPKCLLRREALKLPQFPPHDFLGFNLVQLRQKGENLEVTIITDEGTRIVATPHESEIWIMKASEPVPITRSAPRSAGARR